MSPLSLDQNPSTSAPEMNDRMGWNDWESIYLTLVDIYNPATGEPHNSSDPTISVTRFLGRPSFAAHGIELQNVMSTSISLLDNSEGYHLPTMTVFGEYPISHQNVTRIPRLSWELATAGLIAQGHGRKGLLSRAALADAFKRSFWYETKGDKGVLTFDTYTNPIAADEPLAKTLEALKTQLLDVRYLEVIDETDPVGQRTIKMIVDHDLFLKQSKAFNPEDKLIFADNVISVPFAGMDGIVVHAGFSALPLGETGFLPKYFAYMEEFIGILEPLTRALDEGELKEPEQVYGWLKDQVHVPLQRDAEQLRQKISVEDASGNKRLKRVVFPAGTKYFSNLERLELLEKFMKGLQSFHPENPVMRPVDLSSELELMQTMMPAMYNFTTETMHAVLRKVEIALPRENIMVMAPEQVIPAFLFLVSIFALEKNGANYVKIALTPSGDKVRLVVRSDVLLNRMDRFFPFPGLEEEEGLVSDANTLNQNMAFLLKTLSAPVEVSRINMGDYADETMVSILLPRTGVL